MAFGVETAAVSCINVGSDVLRRYKWDLLILTHGLELADQLLLGPLGPLLLVCVDGTQDRPTWFPTILDGRNIQIMDEHDIRVLRVETGERDALRLGCFLKDTQKKGTRTDCWC